MSLMLTALVALFAFFVIEAPALAAPASRDLKVIYSNLSADPKERYDDDTGRSIHGKTGGSRQAMAMPFTPTESGTIWRIKIALGWIAGPNVLTIRLRADAAGLPGDLIDQVELSDLKNYHRDGNLDPVATWETKGIPVVAGTRYWLAAHASGDSYFGWNDNNTGAQDTYAYKNGSKWKPRRGPLSAFSVMGK